MAASPLLSGRSSGPDPAGVEQPGDHEGEHRGFDAAHVGPSPRSLKCGPQSADEVCMHTPLDLQALLDAGVDPDSTQPREQRVPCWCGALTRNQQGCCDTHHEPPGAITRQSPRHEDGGSAGTELV